MGLILIVDADSAVSTSFNCWTVKPVVEVILSVKLRLAEITAAWCRLVKKRSLASSVAKSRRSFFSWLFIGLKSRTLRLKFCAYPCARMTIKLFKSLKNYFSKVCWIKVRSIISDAFKEVRKSKRWLSFVTHWQHQADLCLGINVWS